MSPIIEAMKPSPNSDRQSCASLGELFPNNATAVAPESPTTCVSSRQTLFGSARRPGIAVLERVVVDRRSVLAEVAGSIDVGAAMVGHGEKHHAVAVNVAGFDEGLLVGFPDAVDDRRLPRISGGAMIEFAAQVDHSHGAFLLRFAMRPRSIQL